MPTHTPTTPQTPPTGNSRPTRSLRSIAILCLLCTGLMAEGNSNSVTFKDPGKPGKLQIYVARGDVRIRSGSENGVVKVRSDAKPDDKEEKRDDGLRVLSSASASFTLTVNENTAELSYGKEGLANLGEGADFDIVVPANTAVEIENGWGGDVTVEKLSGDVAVKGMNCEVKLKDLEGGASVETMNGEINASFAKINADKPISFSSMNGEVSLAVPADAKANVRFRSHNGTILTDFPEENLKTVSENLGNTNWGAVAGQHVRMAGQMAGEIGRQIAEATREVAQEMRDAAKEEKEAKAQAEEDRREAEAAKAEAKQAEKEAKQAASKAKTQKYGTEMRIRIPRPPRPPSVPAISGGKLVSGALNGGGPEILVTTMNGDITLRRLKKN